MRAYNLIAPIYDSLASLIYGNKIEKASDFLISAIQEKDEILILGGGTGKILESIPCDCHVVYIDFSMAMIKKAKKRKFSCDVEFLNIDFRKYNSSAKFDSIMCPFFLDNFEAQELEEIFEHLKQFTKTKTKILVADFDTRELTKANNILLHLMLSFFYSLRATKTFKFNKVFEFLDKKKELQKFCKFNQKNGFIVSCGYHIISPT